MFDLAVFADDIDQDLDHALDVIEEFGLKWVEFRSAWGKNLMDHGDEAVQAVVQAVRARGLGVPCIAAPFLKCRLKGKGQVSQELFHAQQRDEMAQQMLVLRKAIELARLFDTTWCVASRSGELATIRHRSGMNCWSTSASRCAWPKERASSWRWKMILSAT